ncbi:hypothetical protein KXQ82_15490 [Mucilaginibacter sp. HMF5004]|uniref:hypothetical protein n=1 Tax=Mucilaginibacter rivuli TaxID=2857527 RepID=UPI001C5CEB4E|nr:hypothetical protein [Mucilaginibacter rivuli]MBW4891128.1 hypothetical protein [Mucilaginibacter rivuli]
MKKLHNKSNINVPKAEPRGLLCSNNDVNRGSALGYTDKEPTIEELINMLSEIIVDAYVFSKRTKEE